MATATILNLNILVQASGLTKVLGENEKICRLKEGKSISEHVKSKFSQGSMRCVTSSGTSSTAVAVQNSIENPENDCSSLY